MIHGGLVVVGGRDLLPRDAEDAQKARIQLGGPRHRGRVRVRVVAVQIDRDGPTGEPTPGDRGAGGGLGKRGFAHPPACSSGREVGPTLGDVMKEVLRLSRQVALLEERLTSSDE